MTKSYRFVIDKDGNTTNRLIINARCNKCGHKFTCTIERNPILNEKRQQIVIEEIGRLCTRCRGQLSIK